MSEKQANFDELVKTCLDALASNQETLESALERYASGSADLRARLEMALLLAASRNDYAPRPGFVAASRSRLVDRIRREQAVQAGQRPTLVARLAGSLRQQPWLAFALVLVIVLVVAASLAGKATLAETAAAIPGDSIYQGKLFFEDTHLAVTVNETGDARLHMQYAGRRLVEVEGLLSTQRHQFVIPTLRDYEQQLNEAVRLLQITAAGNTQSAGRLAQIFSSSMADYQSQLVTLAASAPADLQPNFSQALAISQNGSLAVQDVMQQVDGLQLATHTPTATPSLAASPVDLLPGPATTATKTPGISATPSSVPAEITPTMIGSTPIPLPNEVLDTPTPTSTEKPKPTRKPTKTPKTLPDPTRRPPHPTPKP